MKTGRPIKHLLLGAVLFLVLGTSGCSGIEPGYTAVKFNGATGGRQVINRTGLVTLIPFVERLQTYPSRVVNASYVRTPGEGDRDGDDSIQAATREGLRLTTDVQVAYQVVDVNRAFDTFGERELTGPNSAQDIHIRQEVNAATNQVTGEMSIFDILSKDRSKLGPKIKEKLDPAFERWGLRIDNVFVRDIFPPAEILTPIAEQNNLRADLDKARTNLQTTILQAKTVITNAEALAKENQLRSSQGDRVIGAKKNELLRILGERWNGEVPESGPDLIPFPRLPDNMLPAVKNK